MVVLLLLVPYIDRNPQGVGKLVRQGAAAGQHHLPDAGDAQHHLHHHRHVLPRAELDFRFSLLRGPTYATGTGNCKLRSSDRARRGLLRSVLPPLGAAPDRVLRAGAVALEERRASAPSWKRARRASSRSSSPASATPAWTAAPPATSPPTIRASRGHAEPLKTHPYSAAMGDVQRNGHWERRHKFSDFGCTVCHDGQGRGLETDYSHGEDEFWPEPLLGYVTQANWRKDFAPTSRARSTWKPTAPSATPRRISPARRTSTAGASCSTP